ncbi:MAG TPA: hypothetical protein VHZ28_02470 [Terracidiphilus sp.]|nr:hypothetical protein [Terracidiphilus sp.]HEX4283928.1 hypothetical protein [Terracidiphilus sp.]
MPDNKQVIVSPVSGLPGPKPITQAQAHPPIIAYSTTADAAVHGISQADGHAVLGVSSKGDGVHGQSAVATMSGVAGINSAGGKGVYGSSSGSAGWFDGNVQVNGNITITGDLFLPGADCAEHFDVASNQTLTAGMLVAIDESGALRQSDRPYDRAVAGVIAGAGLYRPGIILDQQRSASPRAALSLMGKTYCYADATVAPIAVGDLLTSSSMPGHVMKAEDPARAFGSVVGKALQPLASGTGLIPILVALQ